MIVTVDEDPEENPKYINTFNCTMDYFNEHNLDGILQPQIRMDKVPSTKQKIECLKI